jgi:CheY-like chemotaxis protein
MLAAYGAADIRLAKNGDEAVTALQAERHDLVLCDYNLGDGRDGQQVLEQARHRGLLPRCNLFVMVTAENTADMVMGSLECQPDGTLSKPVTRATLQVRLRKLLEKREELLDIYEAAD